MKQKYDAKKWFIPLGALVLVLAIALVTKYFVLSKTSGEDYKIYMVAINDNGKRGKRIGCGDSLVAVKWQTVRPNRLVDVYQDMVGVQGYDFGDGLNNPLVESQLSVVSATVDDSGVARVYLSGAFSVSGKCDAERIRAQLEQPAFQFKGVSKILVYINNILLSDAIKQQTN
ncbi:MAG TPA: hypothetical protein VIR03_01130 [Candidatus Saccharimonadales bacterium]